MQLPRESSPLLLVLFDHPGGEPGQLDGPGLEPCVEIGVLERGADLLPECYEETVVECGEGISRLTHRYEGPDDLVAPEEGQHRGVRIG